jgi:hypothetical protein
MANAKALRGKAAAGACSTGAEKDRTTFARSAGLLRGRRSLIWPRRGCRNGPAGRLEMFRPTGIYIARIVLEAFGNIQEPAAPWKK